MNPLEIVLLILCAAALVLLLWLYLAPLELKGELRRARAEGLAGELGLKLGIASLQAVPSRRRSVQLQLQLGGLRLARWETSPREEPAAIREEERRTGGTGRRSFAWARRHWDLRELLRFVFEQRSLMTVGPLEGRVEFGLEDPALTGEIFGYACAARQMSPALAGVAIEPLWCFENGCWGWLRGRIRVRLLALLLSLALYLATHYRRGRLAAAAGSGPGEGEAVS